MAATPWIFRLAGDGSFVSHTGKPAGDVESVWLVDGESLCLRTAAGFGLVDDRDLPALFDRIRQTDGGVAEDLDAGLLILHWDNRKLPLRRCADAELEGLGSFRRSP